MVDMKALTFIEACLTYDGIQMISKGYENET